MLRLKLSARTGLQSLVVSLGLACATVQAQTAPDASEIARYTGLHAAAQRGDAAAIHKLAARSGGPAQGSSDGQSGGLNARDSNGRTPLHVATFGRQRDAIRALLKAGANHALLDNDRYDAVTIASVADDEDSLRILLETGASAKLTTSRYDGTALIAAAHLGHDGVVRQLIAAGAPLDHVNNLHWTAVIESIVLGSGGPRHLATLKALVDAGANLQLSDRQGNTPLSLAKARGYAGMVALLEKAGAK